jgi:hypothetical protein
VIDPVERSEEVRDTQTKACLESLPGLFTVKGKKKRRQGDPCKKKQVEGGKAEDKRKTREKSRPIMHSCILYVHFAPVKFSL